MLNAEILVMGSVVIDHVIRVQDFPKPGEAVRANQYQTFFGGKGANQAIAAARLGANVSFCGAVGTDSLSESYLQHLQSESIETSNVFRIENTPTGIAMIVLNATGQNTICVDLGANDFLTGEQSARCVRSTKHKVFLTQFETTDEAVAKALEESEADIKIVNPAPAKEGALSEEHYRKIDVLTPNEHETESLVGIFPESEEHAAEATQRLFRKGIRNVILTLGSRGVFVASQKRSEMISAHKVNPIDTVGAGDTFNGALAVGLAKGLDIFAAARFANVVAALSTEKLGAQSGMLRLKDLPDATKSLLPLGFH